MHRWHRILDHSCGLLAVIALSLALSLTLGCGASDIAPARGIVQRDGQPLDGGKVILTPLGEGQPSVGQIESDGTFDLTTNKPGDGATIGQYRVTVVGNRETEGDEPRRTYVAPRDFQLEVKAGEQNEFVIDVSQENGWIHELEE